jgi:hypothetical protein
MADVGYAVFCCQRVEETISHCWLLNSTLQPDGKGGADFVIWDVEENTAANKRRPLGRLLKEMNLEIFFKKPLRNKKETSSFIIVF